MKNTRQYPWRWVNDPYPILVSEFMLHRTQAKQVIVVYSRFIADYPSLEAFSQSHQAKVLEVLHPLGLRWRIEAMRRALLHLWNSYGTIPLAQEKLQAVDGIGQYIAGATICFTLNKPVALIDTNTVRVVGRVFGLDLRGEARRRKSVVKAIRDSCDPNNPRDYYYAMIDLAHAICTSRIPKCDVCPLLDLPCELGRVFVKESEQ